MSDVHLYNGDCLEVMKQIHDNSVDMVLCDLPYGVLNKQNKFATWDSVIPTDKLWEQYNRITKDSAAIVLFCQGMFTCKLMMSNQENWRYNLVWDKFNRPTGFLDANRKPMRIHEDIAIFYKQQPTYNPQYNIGNKCHSRGKAGNGSNLYMGGGVKIVITGISNKRQLYLQTRNIRLLSLHLRKSIRISATKRKSL